MKHSLSYENAHFFNVKAQYGDDALKLPPLRTVAEYERDKALGINVSPVYSPPIDGREIKG